jgi:hypothetical protein
MRHEGQQIQMTSADNRIQFNFKDLTLNKQVFDLFAPGLTETLAFHFFPDFDFTRFGEGRRCCA